MKLKMYQVDAFTDRVFSGNPAAVCPLGDWPADALMQDIAAENNLSETAFFAPEGEGFRLRWFTPGAEVRLCGHATLASAFVLFELLGYAGEKITFHTLSGPLAVRRGGGGALVMDFPAQGLEPCAEPEGLAEALGARPLEVLRNDDYFAVFGSADEIAALRPDMNRLAFVKTRGVCVTAPGSGGADFVSRFFAPAVGVPEDPVTGSAHCVLTPYWGERLGQRELLARQVSRRGGELMCEHRGHRVGIAGRAALYMEGTIYV